MKKKWLLLSVMALTALPQVMQAQDTRERNYYFEILEPRHEAKPQVQGFATERVKEQLDRGLAASPTADGKGIHIGWRLLESDPAEASFHLYRSVNGKQKRLTKKPLKDVCDFTDLQPAEGKSEYWVTVPDKKGKVISTSEKLSVEKPLLTNYRSIKLKDEKTRAGKVAVADLNGDGTYDYIIRTPDSNVDPGMGCSCI